MTLFNDRRIIGHYDLATMRPVFYGRVDPSSGSRPHPKMDEPPPPPQRPQPNRFEPSTGVRGTERWPRGEFAVPPRRAGVNRAVTGPRPTPAPPISAPAKQTRGGGGLASDMGLASRRKNMGGLGQFGSSSIRRKA